MPEQGAQAAHAMVATLRAGGGASAWRLDRAAIADRLDELVADPGRIRQGTLNLCGPAAVFKVWLERDPVAAATYAVTLFEEGAARIGDLVVRPSPTLLRAPHGAGRRPVDCPEADWMMMAALRDSTNRIWRYSRQGGIREGMAAMTLPGALSKWLSATGEFTRIRDETSLVLRKGTDHATRLAPASDRTVFLLLASEMFRRPQKILRRVRDFVVSQVPNHWVILTTPVVAGPRGVAFQFWSWGRDNAALLDPAVFDRCYYGALVAE
jgi:hypothetical protein